VTSIRAILLNNPEVAELLRTWFVCYGLDNVVNPQMTAAEKEWLKDRGGRACTGGTSVFTAGGEVLPHGANWDLSAPNQFANHQKARIKGLNAALSKYHSEKAPQIDKADPKELDRVVRRPFKGGLALSVTYTVLEWKTPPTLDHASSLKAVYEKVIPECPGVDHIWARKAEADALADGHFAEKLKQRLALHVAYGMNAPSKVKKIDLTYRDGRVTGSFQLADGARADVLGFVEARDGKISRFDVIVKATGRGRHRCGGVGPLHVLPEGKTAPVAIGFMLVDPESYMGRVPPHSARDLDRPAIKGSGD
jgi:hypothetical protein